jgi:Flp pilus assembly protein TadD
MEPAHYRPSDLRTDQSQVLRLIRSLNSDYDKAEAAYRITIEHQPSHSQAYLELGQVLEKRQNLTEARQTYVQGIEVASQRGDLMPLEAMQQRLEHLSQAQSK